MARRVVAPDFRISAMIGRTLPAARSASALTAATAAPLRGLDIGIAELDALRLRRRERRLRAPRDQGALFFGERGIEVQDERIDVRPQFGDEEGHAMRHQAGNEMHVARETIELGDRDRAAQRPRLGERRRQLRPTIERVASLAGLDLDELGHDLEPLIAREPRQRLALRLDAQDRSGLAGLC